jgi:hypothetical protein
MFGPGSPRVSAFALMTAICGLELATPAQAANIDPTFNFDNMGPGNTTSLNVSSTTIGSYMTGILQGLGFTTATVSVTGAIGQQGPVSAGNYNADGYIAGPTTSNPLTLGNTNNSPSPNTSGHDTTAQANSDGYIINCNGVVSCSSSSNDISMKFNNLVMNGAQYAISALTFDLEIFPDGSCPSLSNCGGSGDPNLPDLELYTGAGGTGTELASWSAFVPGTSGGSAYTASSVQSPDLAPQLLTTSGTIAASNISSLDFMDWPSTIGIDNLALTLSCTAGCTTHVPEPASLAMFGFGLLGLAGIVFLRRTRSDMANAQQVTG